MRRRVGQVLALAALLAPVGWGPAASVVALALGRDAVTVAGLALLGAVPIVAARTRAAGNGPGGHSAVTGRAATSRAVTGRAVTGRAAAVALVGRWRAPPGQRPHLETERGAVPVVFASDLQAPAPGEPVRLVARLRAGRAPLVVSVASRGAPRGAWLDRWAAAAARRVEQLVPRSRSGLVSALVLGRRDLLPHAVAQDARVTGTAHLFALSGLHVAVVVALIERATAGLGRARGAVRATVLATFVGLAGTRAPLQRAALGWLALAAARRHGRVLAPFDRLLAAAVLVLAWEPALRDDLSARLSFIAVAGLIGAARLAPRGLGWLIAPAGAVLATAPLVVETFGRFSPWGLLVTPLLLPPVAGLLLLGIVAVLPGEAFRWLDPLLAPALGGVARVVGDALELAARWCPPPLRPSPPPLPALVMCGAILAALAVLGHGRRNHAPSGWERVP